MSSKDPRDAGPVGNKTGVARVSRIPRGPRTRSQANSAPDLDVQETPSETQVEKLSLKDRLQKLSDEIREDTKKKFNEDFNLLEKQLELQKSEFHSALEELSARVELVEKSLSDAPKGPEPGVLDSLKLSVKEARRDANQALESLAKSRDNIDDRFDRAAQRLKDLELAAGRPTSRLDLDPPVDGVEFPDPGENNPRVRRSSKSKSSRP